jgi:anti-sigma regulatory factor (Ser/Thr protein kinase)
MLLIHKLDDRIDCTLTSDPSLVELFSHLLQETLAYEQIAAASNLALVARELLMNAAVHGNRRDPCKKIEFSLDLSGKKHFTMSVVDEGSGFDYPHLDMSIPADPRRRRSRGYSIIKSHASRIEFFENGARVTVHVEKNAGDSV